MNSGALSNVRMERLSGAVFFWKEEALQPAFGL
jgi:hypothetical protein